MFLFRDYEKVKTLLTEYETVKESEEIFQKDCEIKMEEYQKKIKYVTCIVYVYRVIFFTMNQRFTCYLI